MAQRPCVNGSGKLRLTTVSDPGVTSKEHRRIIELERENRELRRANEILKAAAAFLARELDPRLPT